MKRSLILASLALWASSFASGQLITFEQTPAGATPIDNTFLNAPYSIAGGNVSFFFDSNGNNAFDVGLDQATVFERTGADGSDAFTTGAFGTSDTPYPAVAAQLGDYFLRRQQPGPPPPPLVVDYNTSLPVTGLSGEVWDIDGVVGNTEQWLVDVLDTSGSVLASQLSPLGNGGLSPLDGRPWTFSFSGLPSGVDKVRITFVGSKTDTVGLAFNNFSPFTAVPEPSTAAWLLVATLCGITGWVRANGPRHSDA